MPPVGQLVARRPGQPPREVTQPMLVVVDTDRVMNATPGQGVGVFTEYTTGGHWHVWWTCDTSKTDESCAFDVKISLASGALTNVAGTSLGAGDQVTQAAPQSVEATTTTTATIQGVTFDTVPGATITVDAQVGRFERRVVPLLRARRQDQRRLQGHADRPAQAAAAHALRLRVAVGLGANLGDRLAMLRTAVGELRRVAEVRATSRVWASDPVGPPQPEFLNAAALVVYEGSPEGLLTELLAIEGKLGRVRRERWGPRTIDLDILWAEGVVLDTASLTLPHPRLLERAFALVPMLEIVPDACDPRTGQRYIPPAGGLRSTSHEL